MPARSAPTDVAVIREAFDHFDLVLGFIGMRRAEDAAPPVPVEEIERLIVERREARQRRDFARADAHPPGSGGAGYPARGFAGRHPLEARLRSAAAGRWRRRTAVGDPLCRYRRLVTALPGPNAQAIIARDAKAVSPSYTRGYPLVMARGEGAIVEDVDGNQFLDCAAGIAVNSTGHSHPDVVAAIVEQSQKFLHMSGTDFYYEPQVRLAEEIGRIVPIDGGVKCFFSNSGTEANEAAIKLARYHSKRPVPDRVPRLVPRPHARLARLDLEPRRAAQGLRAGDDAGRVPRAVSGRLSRAAAGVSPAQVAAESIAWIEDRLFVNLVSPDEVAAIVVEPIQGEGGYIVPPIEFHQRLSDAGRRSTASCWWSTKCSRGWAAPARCSPRSTSACSPTSCRLPRASPRGCRSA